MREKSATEAIIVASALAAKLAEAESTLSDYLNEVFKSNDCMYAGYDNLSSCALKH